MDELFEKAAENYPLKINTGNFDDLMPFIGAQATTVTKTAMLKGKRKTALLLIAFFLTSILAVTYFFSEKNNKTANDKSVSKNIIHLSSQNNIAKQADKNTDAVAADNAVTENIEDLPENIFEPRRIGYNVKGKTITNILQPGAVTDDVNGNESSSIDEQEALNKTESEKPKQPVQTAAAVNIEAKKEIIVKPATKNKSEQEEKKTANDKKKNRPGFYFGTAAGVELNQVKTQDMTKAGFNGGVILGVQLNKKIAVETGVQLSQKKYYSDGKYFKPKTGSMPANMNVSSLQSTSTIIEIPVSVKYNFSKKKNTLYGKAGLSSYIMTKESNNYQAVVSGQQQQVNSTYKANKAYLASDVRISAGYQHGLNKKLNMRVEPYIQIPLKGIGVGSLPVTTTGLQIVLTRN